jgi:Mg2+ and Co2+ transporter CorA
VLDLTTAVAADTSRSGVVACVLYRDGQRIRDIAVDEIGALAGREGGIVWLGLHEPEAALLGAIQSQLGLHDLMIEDANQPHQRGKLDVYLSAIITSQSSTRSPKNSNLSRTIYSRQRWRATRSNGFIACAPDCLTCATPWRR